jgi:hypothetical protein
VKKMEKKQKKRERERPFFCFFAPFFYFSFFCILYLSLPFEEYIEGEKKEIKQKSKTKGFSTKFHLLERGAA